MATIRAYTTIEQSHKLAEILPLESADMCYKCIEDDPYDIICKPYSEWKEEYKGLLIRNDANVIPCWSLVALLDTFPKGEYKDVYLCFGGYQGDKYIPEWYCSYEQQEPFIIKACYADNPVDACYDMILKLRELNLL